MEYRDRMTERKGKERKGRESVRRILIEGYYKLLLNYSMKHKSKIDDYRKRTAFRCSKLFPSFDERTILQDSYHQICLSGCSLH